jgi:hypothetical protein
MAQYQCKQCLAMIDLPPGADPHASTWCGCCDVTDESGRPHHHGAGVLAAEECEAANHPGQPCLSPPGRPDKPEGCTVCRPVMHLAVAGEPLAVS